jgi:hypothetical protein
MRRPFICGLIGRSYSGAVFPSKGSVSLTDELSATENRIAIEHQRYSETLEQCGAEGRLLEFDEAN